jgi:hypothetical protein
VEYVLAGVAKRRMSEIMGQANCFNEIRVRAEGERDAFGNLRDFQGMGEPGPKEVTLVYTENLCFALQPTERGGMDDPRTVTLEFRAMIGRGLLLFRRMSARILESSWLHKY